MFHRIFAVILIACLSLCPIAGHANSGVGGHGVVYFAYDLGTYSSDLPSSSSNNWYVPGRQFKPPVGLYYDLGGESPGLGCAYTDPTCLQARYLNRLWADYTHAFGADDTVGFSTIADANLIPAAFDIYKNVHPTRYAFTAYGDLPGRDVKASMEIIYQGMPASERSKPVMLMETYQNDPVTASQIAGFLSEHPDFNLFAISQWPTTRDPACTGCDGNVKNASIQALNTTTQLSMMGPVVARFSQESNHPQLMSFSDIDCGSSTAAVCTVVGNLGFVPVDGRQAFMVYVITPGQQPRLWSCMSATNPVPASWITRNLNYKFDYYRVSDCSADVSGQIPDATTRLFVR